MEVEEVKKLANFYGKEIHFIGRKSTQTKWINGIINNKRPNPENYFVVEGIWLHEQAYRSSLEVHSFVVCPKLVYSEEGREIAEQFIAKAENVYVMVSEKSFQKISEKDAPHGLVSVCKYKEYTLEDLDLGEKNLIVILDRIEIPGNAGTIIRTIDGAGGDAVIFIKRQGSARMNHPKLIRASQCTCFNIPMIEVEEGRLLDWLDVNGFEVFCLIQMLHMNIMNFLIGIGLQL